MAEAGQLFKLGDSHGTAALAQLGSRHVHRDRYLTGWRGLGKDGFRFSLA